MILNLFIYFRRAEDPFKSEVTLDVGSTYTQENEIRGILENQLRYHSLGSISVTPEGFTFRSSQGKYNWVYNDKLLI